MSVSIIVKIIVFIIFGVSLIQQQVHGDIRPSILGGQLAQEGQFPFMALIMRNGPVCGGAILSARYILTAAHCVHENAGRGPRRPPNVFTVRVGSNRISSGGAIYPVSQIRVHPQYRFIVYDVALMQLGRPIQFSARVRAIQLSNAYVQAGTRGTVPGWGHTRNGGSMSEQLRYLGMTAMADDVCFRTWTRNPSTMCFTKPVGSSMCRGDSGSPMISNGRLIAVSSFGQTECGTASPDGFARVSVLYQWIMENSR